MSDNKQLLDFLKSHVDDETISRHIGISPRAVKEYRKQLNGADYLRLHGQFPPGLKPHAVAFRHRLLTNHWIETATLYRVKREYDEGKIELCQGLALVDNEQCWVLYAIPRRNPIKRKRTWFEVSHVG